jgi:uncharacterized flavoprotein (TIGR03862 family)
VVGAGPAGLAAAEALAQGGVAVTVLEAMPSPARKFLMAGRGGLNLTHSEPLEAFLSRYGEAAQALAPAIRAFPPQALRDWADGLGGQTFAGSSRRVFPRAMKASPLLRAWLARLDALGVAIRTRTRWTGFDRGDPADALVLACGGASWPRLGSDGAWTAALPARDVAPLRPANMGAIIDWPADFSARWAGQPLKGVAFAVGTRRSRGEAVVTARGLEGGAIYALSADLRHAVDAAGAATLTLDLRPDVPESALAARLAAQRPGMSTANRLRRAGVSPVGAALLRLEGPLPRDPLALAATIKAAPLRVAGVAGMARAISSAGGLRWSAIDDAFMLRDRPGVFACGEMLDWEAPTGGYLLQACFATGRAAGRGALDWLSRDRLSQNGRLR